MRIGTVDTEAQVLIVAEIGNNHEGDLSVAAEMIRAAAAAGADAVKFQTIVPERLVAASQPERLAQLRQFQFSPNQFASLAAEAHANGVMFFSTPFDLDSVDWLAPLVPAFKVASGDNDFYPLLDKIASTGKPVLVSLGFDGRRAAASLIEFFRDAWRQHGRDEGELALLHCVAAYPTPDEQADLGAIRTLMSLGVTIGYSDHTLGITAAELAVAAGARIIEKHFTLDRSLRTFRDHQLSADPAQFEALVAAVRRAERFVGPPMHGSADSDGTAARRSIAASRDLPAGTILGAADLVWLRPGTGFRPGQERLLLGRRLVSDVPAGHLIEKHHLDRS